MRIHVERFLGIAPKISTHALQDTQAQVAKNAKLWSQGLRPISGLGTGAQLDKDTGDIQTLFRYDDDWLAWTQDVNAVRSPIANDTLEKLYFTGTDMPRVTTNALWDTGTPGTFVPPASYKLGIPAPTTAPTAAVGAAGNITGSNLVWVYTFVRKYSDNTVEESAPSPLSNAISPAAQQVSLTTLGNTPVSPNEADYGITHKRIYRLAGTEFFFVAEIAQGTTSTTDNVATQDLGEALTTSTDQPPPDGLVGLIELPGGVFAAFKDNVVYLSEPFRVHAFPLVNQYAINDRIVGLGNVGTTVIAITDKHPWIGRGLDPRAYSFKRHPGRFACTSKRSISSGDFGVLWSTPRGMAISDGVTVALATQEFLTKDEWSRDFYPTTIHGIVHDGRYYGWFHNGQLDPGGAKLGGGFVLDRSEAAFLTTFGDYSYAAHSVAGTEGMFVVQKEPSAAYRNHVYQWEGNPTAPMPYEWRSKLFITPGRDNMAFAQIIADYGAGLTEAQIAELEAEIAAVEAFNNAQPTTDGMVNAHEVNGCEVNGDNTLLVIPPLDFITGLVTFKYWVDGVLRLEKSVGTNEPFTLPAGFSGERHEFELAGAVQVFQVTLATSAEELASV